MQNKIYKFSEFESFYGFFKPLTPFGKLTKEKKIIFTDTKALEGEYSLIDGFIGSIKKNKILFNRIEYHLRHIPALNLKDNRIIEISDIFLVKKFLVNTKAVFGLLPPKIKRLMKIKWSAEELYSLLMKGQSAESFYIADSYCPQLKKIRAEISKIAVEANKIKKANMKAAADIGLDFTKRDFLITDAKDADKFYKNENLFIEAYDSENIIIKPIFGERFLKLSALKESLNKKEKIAENKIIKRIAIAVQKNLKTLNEYCRQIEKTDTTIAKARLSENFQMTRPTLTNSSAMIFKKARFIPLEIRLSRMDLKYTPLTAAFSKRINSIRGSNMGGKTMTIKTAAFFQILAQMGFFVPAKYYQTQIFKKISFAGNISDEDAGGLSGFGLEMRSFIDNCDLTEKSLIFMDEFAKTTNSGEATALLSAIMETFSQNPNAFMFISTHFSGLPKNKNADTLKMKGFDNVAFDKHFKLPACAERHADRQKTSLTERLKMINKFMVYEITPDDNKKGIRDAVKIAKILGLDAKIVKLAQKIMEEKS